MKRMNHKSNKALKRDKARLRRCPPRMDQNVYMGSRARHETFVQAAVRVLRGMFRRTP